MTVYEKWLQKEITKAAEDVRRYDTAPNRDTDPDNYVLWAMANTRLIAFKEAREAL